MNQQGSLNFKLKSHLPAFLGYFLISLIYTYPLLLDLSQSTLLLGMNYSLIGNARIIGEELSALRSPLQSDRIFYPVGYTIHEGFLPSLLVYLFGFGKNMVLGLNLSTIFSYLLGGVGAYLLCLEVTGGRVASFAAGCYFTFSAHHYGNLGIYPMAHIGWLPWFLFSLIRFGATGRRIPLILSTLFFIGASLSSWYFAVFIGLIAGIYFLLALKHFPELWKRWIALAGSLGIAALFLLPFSPPFLLGQQGLATGGFKFIIDGSADLLSFFLPPFYHWKLAAWVQSIQQDWLGNPSLRVNYLGTISFLFVVTGVFWGSFRSGFLRQVLLVIALLGFILALGPYLVIDGIDGWSITSPETELDGLKLPYYWLAELFPFSITRAASRYSFLTLLAFSPFLAAGLTKLIQRRDTPGFRKFVLLSSLVVLGVELWPVWPHQIKQPIPVSGFHQHLNQQTEEISVMELPFDIQAYRTLYYATSHRMNVVGGSIDKTFKRFEGVIRKYPYLSDLVLLGSRDPMVTRDVFGPQYPDYVDDVLDSLKIKYAVLHKWDEGILSFGDYYQPEADFDRVENLIELHFNHFFEDELVSVYERRLDSSWLFPTLETGWGQPENHQTYVDRPLLGRQGSMAVHSSDLRKGAIRLELAVILVSERTIEIHLNGKLVHSEVVARRSEAGAWHPIEIEGLTFLEGVNQLEISTPEPTRSIAEVYGGEDTRQISLLLHRILLSDGDSR